MVKQFTTKLLKINNMNIVTIIAPNTQSADLKSVIGKDVSQNQSPTCRARLVSVGKSNCIFESVPSPYDKFPKPEFVGVKYKVPNWIAWNSFFY
jgi:hypothetical protein